MKHEIFRESIHNISEQLKVERHENITKVLWIYEGFDLIEDVEPKKQTEPSVRKKITSFINDEKQIKYHTVAHIQENQEHVMRSDVSGKYIPSTIRKQILKPIAEYTVTPLSERYPTDSDETVIIEPPVKTLELNDEEDNA